MTSAAPKPEDRIAFANKLAQVRAKDVDGEYQKELKELEFEYQFILLRSLELFHKEMRSGSLLKGFTKSKRSLPVPWESLIIKPTFRPLTGIGTASFANSAARWG